MENIDVTKLSNSILSSVLFQSSPWKRTQIAGKNYLYKFIQVFLTFYNILCYESSWYIFANLNKEIKVLLNAEVRHLFFCYFSSICFLLHTFYNSTIFSVFLDSRVFFFFSEMEIISNLSNQKYQIQVHLGLCMYLRYQVWEIISCELDECLVILSAIMKHH